MMNRRKREKGEDVLERRRREDESPRLRTVVPRLVALRLELKESRGDGQGEVEHIRRVPVANAASVFMVPCGEPRCKHGSYDITQPVLSALRRGEQRAEATDRCLGEVGTAECGRILRCVAIAEYAPEA